MNNIPFLEIAINKVKFSGYDGDKYVCRLSIPSSKDQATIDWLKNKGASVLVTDFYTPHFRIIFSTSNHRIIDTITSKYEVVEVDSSLLLKKIREFEIFVEYSWQGEYGYEEWVNPDHKERLDYIKFYENSMIKSNDRGWFYA